MKLSFTKMQGCGNDYIYFNCLDGEIESPEKLSVILSDRHFGIGGDGIILICASSIADAKMRMFNADGSEGKMCGNGTRCIAKYLYDKGIVRKNRISLETLSGIKYIDIKANNGVMQTATVNMGKAVLKASEIPVIYSEDSMIGKRHCFKDGEYTVTCVSMGNPHCVIFTEKTDELDLEKIGKNFECDPIFPEKVNTEFVEILGPSELKMRVWERGSGETLACGTGACAVAVAACENGICKKGEDITVHLKGGDLIIKYTDDAVFMTGSAEIVFEGTVDIGWGKY